MNHIIINHSFRYEIEKLIRVFYPDEKINTTSEPDGDTRYIITSEYLDGNKATVSCEICLNKLTKKGKDVFERNEDDEYLWQTYRERKLAVLLYHMLSEETGYIPPWGILTGIRPSKLMYNYCVTKGDDVAKEIFTNDMLVTKDKTELAYTVAKNEKTIMSKSTKDSFSLYVSIPFCPSRCSYCSFVSQSNEQAKKLIPEYIEKLCLELEDTAEIAKNLGLKLESIYFGGGTPTALEAPQLKIITDTINRCFSFDSSIEYTIESGRPDSINEDKLNVIKNSGAQRISINPQTFNDNVLKNIGRKHNSKQTIDAFNLARSLGFNNINMDIIAGLPGDNLESFSNTLNVLMDLEPENITVHTLALKRSSNIVTEEMAYGEAETALKMLNLASECLTNAGYIPYYMYRQSKCLGNLENVGWTKPGFECEYNVQMMEEAHTVIAVGAGAVTKLKDPSSGLIERIFNFKYPFEYISQFSEILERKKYILDFYKKVD